MLLLARQSTAAQYTLAHLYNLLHMAAILSNHEASLIYYSTHYANSHSRLKATLYTKDKEKWGIFISAAITVYAQPQY